MGDNDQKAKDSAPEHETDIRSRLERLKGGEVLPPELQRIKEEEQKAKKETPRQTSDIKREVLETEVVGPDKETADVILGIEKITDEKEIERQIETIWTVSTIMFAKLYDAGIQKTDVQSLSSFHDMLDKPELTDKVGKAFDKMSNTEKIAFQKLREIARHPESKIHARLRDNWTNFINKSNNLYKRAADARDQLTGEKKPRKKENSIIGAIKKHPIAAVALAAGAVGLFFAFKPKKGESILSKKTAIGLGILVAGALIGPTKIIDVVGKIFHISKEKMQVFMKHLMNGDIKEAFASLWEGGDENMNNYVDIAEKISDDMGKKVEAKVIKKIANITYKDFMSVTGRARTVLMDQAKKLPGGLGWVASMLTDEEQKEQEPVIRDYLKKNEAKIKSLGLENATLAEVLAKLTGTELDQIPAPAKTDEQREKSELEQDVSDLITNPAAAESFGLSKQALKELDGELLTHSPNLKALFNKYENDWSKIPTFEFITGLYSALKKDAIPTIIHTHGLILFTGAKWVTLLSAKSLVNLFIDVAEAPFDEDKSVITAMKNYAGGIAPFALLFASANALKQGAFAVFGKQRFSITEVIKSAGKGFIFPVEVANMYYKGGDAFIRNSKGIELQVKQWGTTGPEKVAILEERARFYAEQADRFQTLYENAQKDFSLKKVYSNIEIERIERLRARYLRNFADIYELLPEGVKGGINVNAKSEVSLDEAAKKAREYLKKAKERGIGAKTFKEKMYEMEAKKLGEEGHGANRKHRFRYGTAEYLIAENELMAKTAEIDAARRSKGEKPAPGKETAWNEQNQHRAANALAEERFLTPEEVPGKQNTFKFAGEDLALDPVKLQEKMDKGLNRADAAKELAVEETIKRATIEETRLVNGEYEYKIGGRWIKAETPTSPAKITEIRQKFQDIMTQEGKAAEFQKFNFENSRALKYFGALEGVLGTAAAVLITYHLETAPDKTKAVAETVAGFGAFVAGQKMTNAALRAFMKPPYTGGKAALTGFIALGGGIAAAFGVTKPVSEVVDQFLSNLIPGAEFAAPEIAGIIEAASWKPVARTVFRSLEKGVLREGLIKVGFTGIEKFLTQRVGSGVLKRIGRVAQKKGFQQIVKCLGWRGAVLTGTAVDEGVPVIGIVDDIVGLGLTAWLAKDIYDLVRIVMKASRIEKEMAYRSKHAYTRIEIADGDSRRELEKKLKPKGLTLDNIMELPEEEFTAMIQELPEVHIRVWREGCPGYETNILRKGVTVGMRVNNAQGELIAEISNEDLEAADEPLDKVDIKDPPAAGATGASEPAAG